MFIIKFLYIHLKKKSYFWFGVLIGIFLSFNYTADEKTACGKPEFLSDDYISNLKYETIPKINAPRKPLAPKKPSKPINRPRYYSTELGMREKLFVGVLTSFENLDTIGVAVNVTLNRVTDKIKYFVRAVQGHRHLPIVSNVVGFTDIREISRPFHAFKYIVDNFLQDYDFFLLLPDTAYINGRKLQHIVRKISITENVYMGSKLPESSYCSLDFGILFSNSVMRKIKDNLDWCVKNSFSRDHSDNIGRCVVHATGIECQEEVQGQTFNSYQAKYFSFDKHLKELINVTAFKEAVSIHPILNASDMYILHSYFSKESISEIKQAIKNLQWNIVNTVRFHPEGFRNLSWPIGDKSENIPKTRYDLRKYQYFNMTHVFMKDDFSVVTELLEPDKKDIQNVLNVAINHINEKYNKSLLFRRIVNGYKQFDESRGLDYIIDCGFKNMSNGKEIIKRLQVTKTLGRIEILPVPYVTENSRVTIILPILEKDYGLGFRFIDNYAESIMNHRERTFLMLVFLYEHETPSKGKGDYFGELKNYTNKINLKNKNSNSKIAWVSIRLPERNSTEGFRNSLNFAIVDLSLKKIGLDALVLVMDVHVDLQHDFLNRVRMNTILNFQIFSAIPFKQYNPLLSSLEDIDINKNCGYFDNDEYYYISFYSKDYVKTRKQMENILPIVRMDNDISTILSSEYSEFDNIFDFMLKYNKELHCIRATEPSLKVKYHDNLFSNGVNIASKEQLAKFLIYSSDKIN